jgi:MoaA/NifB/PqqE/SkfB family radical SAM enzyme
MSLAELKRELGLAASMLRRRPYSLLLQVTNRCNMKCSFCDFWPHGVPPREELSLDDFRRLSRELRELGRFLVSIEGGEPFVRPDLVEIVRAFADDHVPVLFTNGWYVTRGNAKALFDAGLAQAGVSLDFPDARHDAKRVLPGAFRRALEAIDHCLAAAPHGGKQVHIITVLMRENAGDIERLVEMSRERGIGHVITLISTHGYRRGKGVDALPDPGVGARLVEIWKANPHWRFWREYVEKIDDFLEGRPMPVCRAGLQSFNIDHVGNVSPCVEKIDTIAGNIREEPLAAIHARLAADRHEVSRCQQCWTVCRAFSQLMGNGGSARGWWDMATRMRSQ